MPGTHLSTVSYRDSLAAVLVWIVQRQAVGGEGGKKSLMTVLELDGISKAFRHGLTGRKRQILSELSFHLEQGEVFGFLGHNGAGKTTTIKLILGLLRPDRGRITILGQHGATREAKKRIGFLCEEVGLYPQLTADEMLQLSGELFSIDRLRLKERKERLLELVGLADERRVKIKRYSKGMRQRLGVAVTLLSDPDLLLLDEPYSGLDPVGRRQLRKILLALKEAGKTILLSSHIVPDVEAVCDRVGILKQGRISKFLDLNQVYATKANAVEVTATAIASARLMAEVAGIEVIMDKNEAVIARCKGEPILRRLISVIYELGGTVQEVKPLRFSLEDHLLETIDEGSNKTKTNPYREEIELLLSHS
jgi:ABC-2 type transport system ATP-binding protein